jgi:predicted DNA-binding transcriptional regulator YafY
MSAFLARRDARAMTKLVWIVCASRRARGEAVPSAEAMAAALGTTEREIRRCLATLERMGAIP